jgi:hypothetical protein
MNKLKNALMTSASKRPYLVIQANSEKARLRDAIAVYGLSMAVDEMLA